MSVRAPAAWGPRAAHPLHIQSLKEGDVPGGQGRGETKQQSCLCESIPPKFKAYTLFPVNTFSASFTAAMTAALAYGTHTRHGFPGTVLQAVSVTAIGSRASHRLDHGFGSAGRFQQHWCLHGHKVRLLASQSQSNSNSVGYSDYCLPMNGSGDQYLKIRNLNTYHQ